MNKIMNKATICNVYLDASDKESLKRIANTMQIPLASLIRTVLKEFLAKK